MIRLSALYREPIRRILCLGAHADDIEIGCAGTISRLLQELPGVHVSWVVLSANPQRVDEAKRSATQLLVAADSRQIQVADFRESFFPYDGAAIKGYFNSVIREQRPDLVFTHFGGDRHQDHRLVWELTWNTFRDHLILEYEIVKYEGDIGSPSVFVPLTSVEMQAKCDHLWTHFVSQREKRWFVPETFNAVAKIRGIECNAPDGYAEAFHCRKLVI